MSIVYERMIIMEVKIVAYDEDYLYLSNGEKIPPPKGYKFNLDDIKKILEAGEWKYI